MYLRQLLSLAAIAGVAATNSYNLHENNDRALQDSIQCLLGGGSEFTKCCPTADPNDGVCSLLWCVNLEDASINDGCKCGQIETACGQVAMFLGAVDGLSELCVEAGECCADDGKTTNDGFNTCMATAIENGGMTIPDFESLVPGGIPGLEAAIAGSTTPTVPSSVTTVAPAARSESPDGKNDANKYVISTLMSLVGSSLAILFLQAY